MITHTNDGNEAPPLTNPSYSVEKRHKHISDFHSLCLTEDQQKQFKTSRTFKSLQQDGEILILCGEIEHVLSQTSDRLRTLCLRLDQQIKPLTTTYKVYVHMQH